MVIKLMILGFVITAAATAGLGDNEQEKVPLSKSWESFS